jgi:hypothetical protein
VKEDSNKEGPTKSLLKLLFSSPTERGDKIVTVVNQKVHMLSQRRKRKMAPRHLRHQQSKTKTLHRIRHTHLTPTIFHHPFHPATQKDFESLITLPLKQGRGPDPKDSLKSKAIAS